MTLASAENGPGRHYRMPTGFGEAYGPRNVPAGVELPAGPERISSIRVEVGASEDALLPMLPEGVRLARASLQVQVGRFDNLRWLAGRGYSTLSVSVPVLAATAEGEIPADYLCVMWENLTDPIVTGRDELGFPKVFADISLPDISGPVSAPLALRASWQETCFFSADVDHLAPADLQAASRPVVTRRYVPAVGALGTAESDYLTITAPGSAQSVQVLTSATAIATLRFNEVSWQQVPFQFPIINALAAAIGDPGTVPAQVTCVEGHFTAAVNRRLA